MDSKTDRIVAAVILIASFAIFRLSSIHIVSDSRFSMMFSQHLLWNHSFSLPASAFPSFQSTEPVQNWRRGPDFAYHLERWGDRFYYWFPPGSTILSMPYVGFSNLLGVSAVNENGQYDPKNDVRIQTGMAALLMAVLVVITYFTARIFVSVSWSIVIAAGIALGTSVWSTASRSMWIHTWGVFILGLVVWLVARAEARQHRPHPIVLGTCLSWLYFVRPSLIVSIIGVSVYVLIQHRRVFLPLILTGGVWLALFLTYSFYHFGKPLPLYYQSQSYLIRFNSSFWEGLAGILVSPSRGLFVYSPVFLFVGYLMFRYRKHLRPSLTWLALGIVCVHVILMSSYKGWYGGHCYGARYCTDVIPWLALLGIFAVEARQRWAAANSETKSIGRTWTEWSFALLLLGCSVALNGIGANSMNAWYWNVEPNDVDTNRDRLWDWKHPPFFQLPWSNPVR